MFSDFWKKPALKKYNNAGEAIDALHLSIQRRPRPEDVAEIVLDILGDKLGSKEMGLLKKAAKGSLAESVFGYSSMATDFLRPHGAEKQVQKTKELFAANDMVSSKDCLEPEKVEAFLRNTSVKIFYSPGEDNFLQHRLNRSERKSHEMELSKRQYNKRWRLLKRLEHKICRMIESRKKYNFTRIGKSALATKISREDLAVDIPTACFVAYYTSRLNLRSVFTNESQISAFDEISEMLLRCAEKSPNVNWACISYVYPEQDVLMHLSEIQKGELLGTWYFLLQDIADTLKSVWEKSDINLETMIVRKGNDSTTWNQTAAAWNRARDHWIALLHSLGMESLLNDLCPGKVLRLMAADVAAWHRASGKDLHPDTLVWSSIPRPWEVLQGTAQCTKAMVQEACSKNGISEDGWIGPKPSKKAVKFTPTPELVHGVAISSPQLAIFLKQAKWFSGKLAKPIDDEVHIIRDQNGFVTKATKT